MQHVVSGWFLTCLNMILKKILFCIAEEQRDTDCSLLSDRELVEYT